MSDYIQPSLISQVCNLQDANRWAEHTWAVTNSLLKPDPSHETPLIGMADKLQAAPPNTISSAFSGVGCAEVAARSSLLALMHFTKRTFAHSVLWALEVNEESRHELACLPEPPKCCFINMLEGINNKVRNVLITKAPTMHFDDLRKVFKAKDIIVEVMPCATHLGMCPCTIARIHVAGTECVAWSTLGSRVGASGKSVLAMLVWFAQRRLLQEDVIYHENVPDFPFSLLQQELGDMYIVRPEDSVIVCASDCGQPYRRNRRLTIMFHKRLAVARLMWSWTDFAERARREVNCNYSIYFRADEEALAAELAWGKSRSQRRRPENSSAPRVGEDSEWDKCLTDGELQRKQQYLTMMNDTGVCNISQDPEGRPTYTRGLPLLNTITKHSDLLYGVAQRRWLTPCELALVHMLPFECDREFFWFGAKSSYMTDREALGLPPRRRLEIRNQIGNGMSICCIGVGWSFIFMSIAHLTGSSSELGPESSLVRELKRQRST